MILIDRYILRQFFLSFIILTVVLMGMVIMIDLIFQLEEFTVGGDNYAEKFGGSSFVWMLRLMAGYYGPLVLLLFIYLVGLLVVAAMGFTFTALARSGELVTIISGGISLYRVAAPVMIAGCAINALAIVDQEFVVSNMVDELAMRPGDFKYPDRRVAGIYYLEDSRGDLVSCGSFDPLSGQMSDVSVLLADNHKKWTQRITAKTATWNDARHGWDLAGGRLTERVDTESVDAVQVPREPPRITFFATDLSPSVIKARKAAIYSSLLSTGQLTELLDNPAAERPAILRIMHSRFSLMVFNVLLLAFVIPRFLTREPLNPVRAAVRGVGTALGTWITSISVIQFMPNVINPVVAAWLPVVVCLPITALALSRLKT